MIYSNLIIYLFEEENFLFDMNAIQNHWNENRLRRSCRNINLQENLLIYDNFFCNKDSFIGS